MWQKFCQWLLYRCKGWKIEITEKHPSKAVFCLAPHTSNIDFIIGQLYCGAEDLKINFLMKEEWFFWPLGKLLKRMGGIPIKREKSTGMTEILANIAKNSKTFMLCITPEGTRSLNENWKNGFYYIAFKAQIPILLYGVDYDKRLIKCTKTIIPNGNIEDQMKEIKLYYKDFRARKPEKFTVGKIEE